MSKHHHKHSAGQKNHGESKKRPPHKDWRAWVIVGVLLAAIAAYILSLDESLWPGGNQEQPPAPAAP